MPFAQLLSAGIEFSLNQLLRLDPDSSPKLKKLAGKQLQVSVRELPWPLLFSFSEQIDVMVLPASETDSPLPDEVANLIVDCHISLALETLGELRDSSKISQLIQQNKLTLEGDILVAQSFSSLLKELDIDWEEQLSRYTGDVVAHQTFTSIKSLFFAAEQQLQNFGQQLSHHLTEEKAIAAAKPAVDEFCEQVNELRSAVERLDARLSLLENYQQDDN
ncbi:MAG: ubiquinone biosynthesis protein UbiJ [Paraglaciecola sp.]|jgi:ubiquinone biosynthesis protein UbiJ